MSSLQSRSGNPLHWKRLFAGTGSFRIPLAPVLAAALLAAPVGALDVNVAYATSGREASIAVRHVPGNEPLGALRLKLHFKEGIGVSAFTAYPAQAGPWSQIRPEIRRNGSAVEIFSLAPAMGGSRSRAAVDVAEVVVTLAVPQAADGTGAFPALLDSVTVMEALLPFGGKAALAPRLTTAVGKVPAPRAALKDRASGSGRVLSFALARPGRVLLRLLDVKGRTAVTVFDGNKGKGMHEIAWDGNGRGGSPLPGGTYFLRLEAGAFTYERKLEVSP